MAERTPDGTTMQLFRQGLAALVKLAAIADAYDASALDEHRPEWGEKAPEAVVLLSGRGGRTLLTLADAFAAREALKRV